MILFKKEGNTNPDIQDSQIIKIIHNDFIDMFINPMEVLLVSLIGIQENLMIETMVKTVSSDIMPIKWQMHHVMDHGK